MIIFNPMRYFFGPIVLMSQAIPTFALAPLLVLWFGYGISSKIMTVILMLFFPITHSFYEGLKQTPQPWLDMANTMTGKPFRILWHIRIPAAFPNLAIGIRLATVIAPLGAVISEWIGSSEGLGYLILNASAKLETDLMFACILTLMLVSLLMYLGADKILRGLSRTFIV
jgi:putative hydroxymethylpyrimidine transport system permease protein